MGRLNDGLQQSLLSTTGTPREETLKRWAKESAPHFSFALKVVQDITHEKKLEGIEDTWRYFHERARSCLGDKTGPFLFQLPPSLARCDGKLIELAALIPAGARIAIEFRHASWFCEAVVDILRKHDMALVENITPDNSLPSYDWVTATWTYTRLHGPKVDIHAVSFGSDVLDPMAARAVDRRSKGIDQYIFFLNDVGAEAPKNAATLSNKITALIGDPAARLVSRWRGVREVPKDGPGSLKGMFAKAAVAKHPADEQPADSPKKPRVDDDVGEQQQQPLQHEHSDPAPDTTPTTTPTKAKIASSPAKGTLLAFFAKKD